MKVNSSRLLIPSLIVAVALTLLVNVRPHLSQQMKLPDPPSPDRTVRNFFEPKLSATERARLVSIQPLDFVECVGLSSDECVKLREVRKKPLSDSAAVIDETPDRSPSIDVYLREIGSGRTRLIAIKETLIDGNSARVRIEVDADGEKLVRDALLTLDVEWKIFEIAFDDFYPNFVPFRKP